MTTETDTLALLDIELEEHLHRAASGRFVDMLLAAAVVGLLTFIAWGCIALLQAVAR
jgi:hypothetical protein